MKKRVFMLLLVLVICMSATVEAEDIKDRELFPYYEAYSAYADSGRFWIEVPNNYGYIDQSDWFGYPGILITDGNMEHTCLVCQMENGYRKHQTMSQARQSNGFYKEGKAVTEGKSTDGSKILDSYEINGLPAWRVEMIDQDYEMIWLKDGEDLYYLMYPVSDAEYADQMRRMANSFVVVDSPNMKAAPETDFEFVITDGAAAITAYIGNDFHVLVPDTLDGAPVREIGETAFYESDVLEVVLPDSIEVIGPFAFSGCTHMVRLHLPSALKAVPSGMLESCFRLDWLNLEQTQIQTIGAAAFWGDQYLEEIGFPDTLESIEHDNFVMCDYLGYFSVSDTCVGFTTDADGQVLLSRDGKTLLHAGCWLGTDGDGYIVPDGVEIIRSYAFAESINLTTVTLPDSLREIGGCAFFNTALKELHIPAGVERIGTMITDKGPGTVNIGNGIKIYFGASGSAAETFCKQFDLNFVEEKQETETIK